MRILRLARATWLLSLKGLKVFPSPPPQPQPVAPWLTPGPPSEACAYLANLQDLRVLRL